MLSRAAGLVVLVAAVSVAAAQGSPRGAWLGVSLDRGAHGARIRQVVPGTPAEQAGLLAGDQILAVGDQATSTNDDLIRVIAGYRVGDVVTLKVERGDRTLAVDATLAPRLDDSEVVRKVLIDKRGPLFDLSVVSGTGSGKLEDYSGKVVVLEFFSVTCTYCPLTHDALAKAQNKYGADGFVALAISADPLQPLTEYLDPDHEPKVRVIQTRFGNRTIREPHYGPLGYPVLHDATGAVRTDYWVGVFPTLVVIDGDGYVRHIGSGAGRETDRAIARAIELLDEPR